MPAMQPYQIYINASAGTVQNIGGEKALKALISSSGIKTKKLLIAPPEKLFDHIQTIDTDDKTPILIGGGDGTLLGAAQILMDKNLPFGILPMGTMNLLANDLTIPSTIEAALKYYASSTQTITIDTATAGNQLFLCSAAIGTIPESSEFREENRDQQDPILMPRLTLFVLSQLDRKQQRRYKITLDSQTKTIKSSALVISNNQYQQHPKWDDPALKRQSLQDGILGLYSAAPHSLWDKLRLLLRLGIGGWQKDPRIQHWQSRSATIHTPNETELISLDGETKTLPTPITFTIQPKSLKLLIPKE